MNKKETIKGIKDIASLATVVADICAKSGLVEIEMVTENVLRATEKSVFKNKTHKFIVTLSELNGKVRQLADLIKKNSSSNEEVTIVTSDPKISEYFKKWIVEETNTTRIEFWNQQSLIEAIDKYLPNYWGYTDLFLKSYEEGFYSEIEREMELKKVLRLDKKFDDLLSIFIEPKIYIFKENKETERPAKVKISIEHLLRKTNYILSGDAGTGKSTLLKHVGKRIIERNKEKGDKTLPIYIKPIDIADAQFDIETSITNILNKLGVTEIDKVYDDYHVVILIDSIDEFERENQNKVIEDLNELVKDENVSFILGTRNYENLIRDREICKHQQADISNFDQRQVRMYLDNFFKFDLAKSDKLWENLLENNFLERVPVTPLTISLVSILFEERQYEVPAV